MTMCTSRASALHAREERSFTAICGPSWTQKWDHGRIKQMIVLINKAAVQFEVLIFPRPRIDLYLVAYQFFITCYRMTSHRTTDCPRATCLKASRGPACPTRRSLDTPYHSVLCTATYRDRFSPSDQAGVCVG